MTFQLRWRNTHACNVLSAHVFCLSGDKRQKDKKTKDRRPEPEGGGGFETGDARDDHLRRLVMSGLLSSVFCLEVLCLPVAPPLNSKPRSSHFQTNKTHMNTTEIDLLKSTLMTKTVLWYPDKDTAREVLRVGVGMIPVDDEDAAADAAPVQGECAFLTRGDYLALEHCDVEDFVMITPLPGNATDQPTGAVPGGGDGMTVYVVEPLDGARPDDEVVISVHAPERGHAGVAMAG